MHQDLDSGLPIMPETGSECYQGSKGGDDFVCNNL